VELALRSKVSQFSVALPLSSPHLKPNLSCLVIVSSITLSCSINCWLDRVRRVGLRQTKPVQWLFRNVHFWWELVNHGDSVSQKSGDLCSNSPATRRRG
jgi:hypothetical protein